MTDSIDPTTAAVQAAQNQRRVDAEACDVRYRNKLMAGQSPLRVHEEYLAEGRAIDADYERAVEPWRQHFIASNPGKSLPPFLTPGFKSFSARQQTVAVPQPKKTGSGWLPLVIVGVVVLFVIGGCVSMTTNGNEPEKKAVALTMSDEEKFIKLTRQETSLPLVSDAALINLAKSGCTTLRNGGTTTEVLISIMDNIPNGDQEDVIKTFGFGIAAFCPDQSSKVSR